MTTTTVLNAAPSMATNTAANHQGITILRIKRKRDEEVPEVLVVESSAKKGNKRRKSGMDVFQLAETVEVDQWERMKQEEIQNRLSELAKTGLLSPKKPDSEAMSTTSDRISRQSSSQNTARQYRIVPPTEENRPSPVRSSAAPPKVWSSKELATAKSLRMYDAVPASEPEVEVDEEMEKFQNLLQDYLAVSGPAIARSAREPAKAIPTPEGDYVYDIFYQRPSTLSEIEEAANFATVTGLPEGFDEDDYDFESESEFEDEADEDSNAEDFYRNDYPDGEESDWASEGGSDMFHESSNEDFIHDNDRFEPDDD